MEQGTRCERFGLDPHRGNPAPSQLALVPNRVSRAEFLELIHSYDAMVLRVALALTASKPAAQEIYCRVFRDAFASSNAPGASSSVFIWLYRIVAKHCLEYCRHTSTTGASAYGDNPASRAAQALLALPPMERMVFQLKQFQGLRICTLAEIFDAPPEFIIATLQNATSRLRKQMRTAPRDPA
jgi:RNA polymerase sigma-70 factor, ECF subfamily